MKIKSLALSCLFVAALTPQLSAAAFVQPGKISDPKIAASRLYAAWRTKSRARASQVATDEAVKKLFGVRWRPLQFKGCQLESDGVFQCVYHDPKGLFDVSFNVEGGASAGYGVTSVSFSSEE
jgi:hypothetical protein